MKNILLPIRASHFKYAKFKDREKCPIALAACEFFKVPRGKVLEFVISLDVHERTFLHAKFSYRQYKHWRDLSAAAFYDDRILFSLELTEVKREVNCD